MKNRKLPIEEKRVYEVKIRLNLKEKRKLDEVINMSKSHAPAIFRMLLMRGKMPNAAVPLLDIQTYYQLRKIGLTYNQYMKAIHQSRVTELDQNMVKQLKELLELVSEKIHQS